MAGESYILMGVSGSGKSLIGSKIATLFSAKFIDGDDLHPAKNIDKMSQGIPLTGNDSNLLIVFYVQIMPDDFVMQLHRF